MRRLIPLFFLGLVLSALAACESRYQENDLELITAYRAKTMCSCMFTEGNSEEFCAAYSLQNPAVATYRVDVERQRVEAQAVLLWGDSARYTGERFGCVFEE